MFATDWSGFAISHSVRLAGVAPGAAFYTVVGIIGYLLAVIAVSSSIIRVRRGLR